MTLSEFMADRGLKDDDLAEPLGVSRSMVTKLRQRVAKPSFDVMSRIVSFSDGVVGVPDMEPIARHAPSDLREAS